MKALSDHVQWAFLLAKGWKDVENRSWPIPKSMKLPIRIYLHASQHLENSDNLWLARRLLTFVQVDIFSTMDWKQYKGTIIGEADITSCTYRFWEENDNLYSPWHIPGQFGFKMANPVLYDIPIPYKGRPYFFNVELPKPPVFLTPTDNGFQELPPGEPGKVLTSKARRFKIPRKMKKRVVTRTIDNVTWTKLATGKDGMIWATRIVFKPFTAHNGEVVVFKLKSKSIGLIATQELTDSHVNNVTVNEVGLYLSK